MCGPNTIDSDLDLDYDDDTVDEAPEFDDDSVDEDVEAVFSPTPAPATDIRVFRDSSGYLVLADGKHSFYVGTSLPGLRKELGGRLPGDNGIKPNDYLNIGYTELTVQQDEAQDDDTVDEEPEDARERLNALYEDYGVTPGSEQAERVEALAVLVTRQMKALVSYAGAIGQAGGETFRDIGKPREIVTLLAEAIAIAAAEEMVETLVPA
jgi:hypothetical protein